MLKVGDVAPDFMLKDGEGNEMRLYDFRGKWVVLYFYPKDDTPGCTREAVDFNNLAKEFEKLGAVVVGVSPDTPESHSKFASKYGLNLKLLSDVDKDVIKVYGAWGKRKIYGKEMEGVIRSTFLIDPEGKIVKLWQGVKVKGHAQDVLNTLKSMLS